MINSDDVQCPAWERLSFITNDESREGGGSCFWSVLATGDYGTDVATGRSYALELLDYIRETGDAPILSRLMDSFPSGARRSGIEIGFLTSIGLAAAGFPALKADIPVAVSK